MSERKIVLPEWVFFLLFWRYYFQNYFSGIDVFPTLVTTYGLKSNKYSGHIQKLNLMKDLF